MTTLYLEFFETAHGNRCWRFVDEPRQYQPHSPADGRVLRTIGPVETDMEASEIGKNIAIDSEYWYGGRYHKEGGCER